MTELWIVDVCSNFYVSFFLIGTIYNVVRIVSCKVKISLDLYPHVVIIRDNTDEATNASQRVERIISKDEDRSRCVCTYMKK